MIFTQRFQKASCDAGLPQIRFHDLRHGHVTYLMQLASPSRRSHSESVTPVSP
jgi:integrase